MDTTVSVRQLANAPSLLPAQLMPNPSKQQMVLSYQLETTQTVRVALYTPAQQLVWTRQLGKQPSGEYQLPLERGQLPTGLYYLRLEVGDAQRVLPLIWR